MASKSLLLKSLQEKSVRAEQTLLNLKSQFEQLKKSAVTTACTLEEERLKAENTKLKNEVSGLRAELVEAETKNGLKQVPLPSNLKSSIVESLNSTKVVSSLDSTKVVASLDPSNVVASLDSTKVADQPVNDVAADVKPDQALKQAPKAEKQLKKNDKKQVSDKSSQPQPPKVAKDDGKSGSDVSQTVDVSKLNMKIGKIVTVDKHPDADSLYVERVDLGEGKERVIISGLVKHVPIEEMRGRLAVFLTNLKPAKMRGILSEGMIMCANTPEKVEIIEPPPGAEIGDRVVVEGYPGEPEEMLNPKKKTWEAIVPDLQANNDGFATYKGALWKIEGKGYFKAPTVRNGQIK